MGMNDSKNFSFFFCIGIVLARENELFVIACHIATGKVFFPAAYDTKQTARFFRKFFLCMFANGIDRLWRHVRS